jgi:hypothetical protein
MPQFVTVVGVKNCFVDARELFAGERHGQWSAAVVIASAWLVGFGRLAPI